MGGPWRPCLGRLVLPTGQAQAYWANGPAGGAGRGLVRELRCPGRGVPMQCVPTGGEFEFEREIIRVGRALG